MHTHAFRTSIVALAAFACWATPALAQDQDWLRMWTEAQSRRPAQVASRGRIAPEGEPGTPLVIHGRVVAPDGRTAVAGATVFAYQTGADGLYWPEGQRPASWRLSGWAVTGDDGRFEFRTIRPGSYPGRQVPAHVHVTVESAAFGRQSVGEVQFEDDPLVGAQERSRSAARGEFGGVRPVRVEAGVQHVDVAFRLSPQGDF